MEDFVKKTQAKIDELTNICFRYAEYAYKLIGSLDEEHLDESEQLAVKQFKEVINSCIEEGSEYQDYLEKRYILKTVNSFSDYVDKWAAEKNTELFDDLMSDCSAEDDTDIIIIDKPIK